MLVRLGVAVGSSVLSGFAAAAVWYLCVPWFPVVRTSLGVFVLAGCVWGAAVGMREYDSDSRK